MIVILIAVISVALLFIIFACLIGDKKVHEKKPVEMKGDLVPEKAPVKEEKKEKMPQPKRIRRTPDYDTSDAVVLFYEKERFNGWVCRECGTENGAGDRQCMVCSIDRTKSERG